MPKANKGSACGNNHLSHIDENVDEMIPSSQEELSSSELEPDSEVSFQQFSPPNKFQACSSHTLKVPKWTEQ